MVNGYLFHSLLVSYKKNTYGIYTLHSLSEVGKSDDVGKSQHWTMDSDIKDTQPNAKTDTMKWSGNKDKAKDLIIVTKELFKKICHILEKKSTIVGALAGVFKSILFRKYASSNVLLKKCLYLQNYYFFSTCMLYTYKPAY